MQALLANGVVSRASETWSQYDVITTVSPWSQVSKVVRRPPRTVHFVKNLQREHLLELASQVGAQSAIVGIGSGTAMDAAKVVAKFKGSALIQVPSTASNNAYCTTTAWTFDGRTRVAERGCPVPNVVI